MLKILAFDTATTHCLVVLTHHDGIVMRYSDTPMHQSKSILPFIQEVLGEANLSLSELDAIAYTFGPGSFTGIRLANSVAQGLSRPLQIPLLQISTLQLLAQSAYLSLKSRIKVQLQVDEKYPLVAINFIPALDAKLRQVYWACYKFPLTHPHLSYPSQVIMPSIVSLQGTEKIDTPEVMYQWCEQEKSRGSTSAKIDFFAIGDGFASYPPDQHQKAIFNQIQSDNETAASALAELAIFQWLQGKMVNSLEAEPHYLRKVTDIYRPRPAMLRPLDKVGTGRKRE